MTVDVAVVGGGISGLTVAFELARRGHRVVVLERQVQAGGNAISERIGGFLMEHGPTSISAGAVEATALSRALGLDPDRLELGSGVRHRYLVKNRRLDAIPIHPSGFFTSSHLSWRARLRLLAEPLVGPASADSEESIAGFWCRRFGAEFTERVIDPLVGGLFAGRAEELSMAAAFPRLLEMEREYGSIIRAMLARRRAGGRMPGRRLFSWRDGVGTLPRRLAEQLGPKIVRTGVVVRRLRQTVDGFAVDAGNAGNIDARAVVLATQPHVAATLLDGLDRGAAEAAAAIDAPPLAVVFLGYRREQVDHPLDGVGFLAARSEGRALGAALFCSTMFEARAPEGHVAIAGYLGGARAPELARLPPDELIAMTRTEFGELLGARGTPVRARVRQWLRGLPQYRLGHGERIARLGAAEQRRPGLFLTGNYFTGPSIASCVEQAGETAAQVDAFLLARGRRERTFGVTARGEASR